MTRRQTPQEKKRLAHEKDHVLQVEFPHQFRRSWPRKKARVNRQERRHMHQYLDTLLAHQHLQVRNDTLLPSVKRDRVRKWPGSVVPLARFLKQRRHRIVLRTGHNFFKQPYDHDVHHARFIAFLTQLMSNTSPYTCEVARMFRELLLPEVDVVVPYYSTIGDRRRVWLHAFLTDSPEWREALDRWIHCCQKAGE